MRVGVTGSTGMLGAALRAHLAAEGHEVEGLRRSESATPERDGWNPAAGWISPLAFEGCDALVHLSGASIGEKRWTGRRKRVLWDSRIPSTRLLVDHLGRMSSPPRVLVSVSASGYYGDRGDERLTEDMPAGEGFLADLVQTWEAESQRATRFGVRVVSPRLGVILDREEGALPRLVFPVRLGVGGPLGGGKQWMPWVTLRDAVRAIGFLLASDLAGPVNVAAPGEARNREVMRALGRQLRRPTIFPVPAFALRIVVGQAADELLLASARLDSSRLLEAGFAFEHANLEDGLRAVLAAGG